MASKNNVLVIGDLHLPWDRTGYLQFCKDLYEEWGCNQAVFIGDVVELHSISFHNKHPECPAPLDEYKAAKIRVQEWYKAFPTAKICCGNHDERILRLARSVSIPEVFMKAYNEVWGTPKWQWAFDWIIDDVYYFHGDGSAGIYPACNAMRKMLMSTVMGHCHTASGIKWFANPLRRIFALDTGCGIDDKQMAFAYAKHAKQRSIISAAVIVNGRPYLEIMPIGKGEEYYDGK